ncbi:MAG TPA: sugar-binding transcriptional regulator [Anaerolineaceae bacterium]|nr:sugar-binding transcriptional regulator [Anaerolineaceae bacterium]
MTRLLATEELRLLIKVSKLYYEERQTEDEIVQKLQLSRSKISRLLKQARDEGIVKITVISPPGVFLDLEMQLESRFQLLEAIVVEARQPDSQMAVTHELGIAAAGYMHRTVRENDVIGISWGSTLHSMVETMQPSLMPTVQIIQIIGGLGRPESEMHATELCRRLSRLLSCNLVLLPAPGIVDNNQIKEVILSDSHVQRALSFFPKLTTAIVGIGSPTPDSVVMRDGSIINRVELDDLLKRGAVGDIALRFFDAYGQPVESDVNDRVIGISLQQLSRVERVVGVGGGPNKFSVIRAALRGRLINTLITDHATARQLLESDTRNINNN